MVDNMQPESNNNSLENEQTQTSNTVLPARISKRVAEREQMERLPHRNRVLHWSAFVLAILALILLAAWVFSPRGPVPTYWVWLEISLSLIFGIEFFTRSGFRWTRAKYLRTHFFDFVAIIPALLLVNHGYILESAWVWLILVARVARVIDRLLGDGFIRRLLLALIEGFEEEITDRVLDNIIARIQSDMDEAQFSRGVAEALIRNKTGVLNKIRSVTPQTGTIPRIARFIKLDSALEKAEEKAFDSIVEIVSSEEIDRTIRDVVNNSLSRIRNELGRKSWKEKIRIRR